MGRAQGNSFGGHQQGRRETLWPFSGNRYKSSTCPYWQSGACWLEDSFLSQQSDMERKLCPNLPFSYRFCIIVRVSVSFVVFLIWRCPEYCIFYVNWDFCENTDGNAMGSLPHNIIWVCLCTVTFVFFTWFCLFLSVSGPFCWLLPLLWGVQIPARNRSDKIITSFFFSCTCCGGGIIIYTYTQEIKEGDKAKLPSFQALFLFWTVWFSLQSQQITVTCHYSIHTIQ